VSDWYRLNYAGEVSRSEVLRETPQFVVIKQWGKDRRVNKVGEFFPTFAEMKQYLVEKRKRQVEHFKEQLRYAESQLAKAESMEEEQP